MDAALFASTVLIWGSTWIAIAMELGSVPVLVSVFYRFALAAAILLLGLAATRRLTLPAARHHPFILAQALCLFCLNFLCFYTAESTVASGLVSVVFSLATLFNAVNARLFFGTPITGRVALAALLGLCGLLLLFARDLAPGADSRTLGGVGLAALGTLFFSLGNMASRRNSAAGIPPLVANAWGMLYGSVALYGLIVVTGTRLVAPPNLSYVGALVYLSAVGSVVGFTAYLSLVARMGPSRAAYTTVLFPVVALAISTVAEGYRWDWTGALGLAIALCGNILIFTGGAPARRPAPAGSPALVPRPR